MLPFAIVLAVLGAAIWFMLSREMALGVWLLAAVLVGHGLVHLLFFVPQPAATAGAPEWPFDMARSWMVTGAGLDLGTVRVIGATLIAVVAACFVVSGLATIGVIVPPSWWRPAVVASAIASIAVLALFFNPQLVLGLAIDGILLGVVATAVWAPAGT
jgi:hypothetical protein